jgi:antitoxin (DNA-binding transcriptional repressor) of toxin-antitoxin stability system
MTIININEAKTHLSRYAKRIKQGETIILADRNKPFAEIRPLSRDKLEVKKIKLGQLKDLVGSMDCFFNADNEIESNFLSSAVFPNHEEVPTRPFPDK